MWAFIRQCFGKFLFATVTNSFLILDSSDEVHDDTNKCDLLLVCSIIQLVNIW